MLCSHSAIDKVGGFVHPAFILVQTPEVGIGIDFGGLESGPARRFEEPRTGQIWNFTHRETEIPPGLLYGETSWQIPKIEKIRFL